MCSPGCRSITNVPRRDTGPRWVAGLVRPPRAGASRATNRRRAGIPRPTNPVGVIEDKADRHVAQPVIDGGELFTVHVSPRRNCGKFEADRSWRADQAMNYTGCRSPVHHCDLGFEQYIADLPPPPWHSLDEVERGEVAVTLWCHSADDHSRVAQLVPSTIDDQDGIECGEPEPSPDRWLGGNDHQPVIAARAQPTDRAHANPPRPSVTNHNSRRRGHI